MGGGSFVFARTAAHAGAFSPGVISPSSFAHIRLGDLVTGVIETPRSEQRSTRMVPWGSPDLSLLAQIHGPKVPRLFEIILEPKIAADLPHLGGGRGRIFGRARPYPRSSRYVSSYRMRKSINQSKRDCIRPKIAAPEKAPPRAREKNMLAPPSPLPFTRSHRIAPRFRARCLTALQVPRMFYPMPNPSALQWHLGNR